jgi:hypothetical protein
MTITPQEAVDFFNAPASVFLQCSAATPVLAENVQLIAAQAANFVSQQKPLAVLFAVSEYLVGGNFDAT